MLKSLEVKGLFPSLRPLFCSSASLDLVIKRSTDWKWKRRTSSSSWRWAKFSSGPILGFSLVTTIKDLLGQKPFVLDESEIKDKVKKAWLARRNRRYEEAVQLLHEALRLAIDSGEQLPISRVYDEMANTYYEMGSLDEAEKCFRLLIHRLMDLHGKKESSPEFIEVSLKLSDIFAQKGDLEGAEAGYMHCVTRQTKVLEKHLSKFLVSHGARIAGEHPVEMHGEVYTDPIALFGMCLERYAFFLVKYRDSSRLEESQECFNEALKVSHQLFGSVSFHIVNLLNNYGIELLAAKQFELAKKYLSLGIHKVVLVNECSPIISGYYCNYAEALFHCGEMYECSDFIN
ncbi:unnamed protein product [Enterobius vermicularis]|uniref:TPR_MalT domain-containing protein n=1 Tax=Enterobius vermicularis TaxID=51028 RepID=A0A0N4VKL6_ENTVE|nr:unnamed protein product [Enterobius vermicularis]